MDAETIERLRARSPLIREHWETLLRIERVSGPLANPDALVHLIPDSIERVLAALSRAPARIHRPLRSNQTTAACECGRNPYIAYFGAGEQALAEAVILIQADLAPEDRRHEDVAETIEVTRRLARAEIEAFCGVCTYRCADLADGI